MFKRLTAALLSLTIMVSAFAPAVYALDETQPQQVQIEEQQEMTETAEDDIVENEDADVLADAETTEEQLQTEEAEVQQDNITQQSVEEVTFVTENVVVDTDLPENDEIFDAYVEQQFYGNEIAVFGTAGRDRLSDTEKAIYDLLKARIEKVAENGGTTAESFAVSDIFENNPTFTATDLGISAFDNASSEHATIVWNAFKAYYEQQFNTHDILVALLHDCPYELYWFDKVSGMSISSSISYSGVGYLSDAKIIGIHFSFKVAADYQSGDNTTVTSEVADVKTAVANANAIAEKYAGKSDYEKMLGFKNEICALTDYNYDALTAGTPYGNPWQMIYVFDGDETTRVVCEGYSKAFQYLCDMTGVECYTTKGDMDGGTGAGDHMWNIVPMGNSSYLVDITNSDAGTIGQDGQLFLAGTAGDVENGYVFKIYGSDIEYTYDAEEIAMWGSELLTLASEKFNPVPKEIATGTYGENISWTVQDTDYDGNGDKIVISGSGEIADIAEATPWDIYKAGITDVIIQEGITAIGMNMFSGYTSLKSVELPQTLTKIGAYAFSDSALAEIIIPEGVTEIKANTFSGCESLKNVVIPATVKTIGFQAFAGCTALTAMEIPEGVITIDKEAFANCTDLKEITLPTTLASVQTDIFYKCKNLETVIFNGSAQNWYDNLADVILPEDADVEIKGEKIAYTLNGDSTGYVLVYWSDASGDVTVAESYNGLPVTEIGEAVFAFNNEITSVVIPSGVTVIGTNAFNSCKEIKTITLPAAITVIGNNALAGCTKLDTIIYDGDAQDWYDRYLYISVPEDVYVDFTGDSIVFVKVFDTQHEELDEYKLYAWSKASGDIVIPATFRDLPVTQIYFDVFAFNENVTSIEIPEGIEVIQAEAFKNCTNLKSVKIPESLWGIGENVFDGCDSLETVYYPSSYNWNHNAVTIYSGNEILENVEFEFATDWGYKYISGYFCLIGKENITEELIIPATINGHTVDMIYAADREPVFKDCTQIKTVLIGNGIKALQADAFNGCTGIEEMIIPESLTTCYGDNESAFKNVPKEAKIYIAESNRYAKSVFKQLGFTNVLDYHPIEDISVVETLTLTLGADPTAMPVVSKVPAKAYGKIAPVWTVAEGYEEIIEIITDDAENQQIKAKSLGNAKIIVTDSVNGFSKTVDVTVKLPAKENLEAKVYLDGDSQNGLKFGETARIEIYSATAGIISGDKIKFTGAKNITVDENGIVTSVYAGAKPSKAVVTATLKTENKSVKVEIPLIVALAGITAKDVTAEIGKTVKLPAVTKVPATAGEDISVLWTVAEGSEDIIEIVTDENDNTVINAKDIGIAQLVATDVNSGFATTVNVTVKLPKSEKLTAVWDIAIDKAGLQVGENRTMQINGSTLGELDSKYFDFKSSNEKAVTVDENGVITVVFTGSGTSSANTTITATVKGDTSKKVSLAVKAIPKQTEDIEIIATYDNAEIQVATDEESGVQTLIIPRTLVKDGTLPISIKAVAKDADGNEVITNVKWSSDASNIAKVVAVKGTTDSADVTVGKNVDGIAVITATANDLKKTTSTIEIDVRDYTPRLETNTVTLNTFKTNGEGIALYTAYDAILQDYTAAMAMLLAEDTQVIDVNLSGKGAENFYAVYDSENGYVVFNADNVVKNGTYKLNLNILTAEGETTQVVTIKVANKLPKVTIKQAETFELFLKDSTADIVITAKDPVNTKEDAVITAVRMEECDTFAATDYNEETDSITVSYLDQNDTLGTFVNGKTADTKVNLVVEFDGYREAHIQKNFTVKAKETKVALKPSRTSTKYTALGNDNTPINVINTKTKEVLDLTDCTVTAQSASAGYVTVNANGTELTINPILNGDGKFEVNGKVATSHSAKIDVQNVNWLRPITISHSININTAVPTVKLKASTLKLNSAFDTEASTVLVPSLDNCQPFDWEKTEQPTKTQTAEDFAKLNVEINGWDVVAKFVDENDVPAKGSYKYLLTTDIAGKEVKLTLTVNVAETLPSVTLTKTSVKLNSAVKEDAGVQFKVPAGYELTGSVITNGKGNMLTDADINVEYVNGEIAVKVVNENLAKGNYKYDIIPTVKLAGEEYSKETQLKKVLSFTVSVFNGQPSVTYSAKGKIDLAVRDTGITYTLTKGTNFVYSAADVNPETFVLIGTDADKFNITYLGKDAKGQHMVEVKANADAQLNKGGKYSYNIAVNVDGMEEPVTMAKAVTVSPSQSTLRLVTKGSTTIWQSYKGTNWFRVEATTPIGAEIADVKILETKATTVPNGALDFEVSQRPDGSWKVSYTIKKASKLKVNKTYKVALEVTPEGNGENVKPQVLNVTLKVKR